MPRGRPALLFARREAGLATLAREGALAALVRISERRTTTGEPWLEWRLTITRWSEAVAAAQPRPRDRRTESLWAIAPSYVPKNL